MNGTIIPCVHLIILAITK